ncbi:hypothetical protein MTR67_026524 [Solanum verrucosum]|uniref:Uncharacterized protein n=1 Tax=Solanum verrucosum TaxID=315347 RepID=A0AAF0R7W6_SOLVR|nr:hypothetical protein MTR67_026524 [Solanum verrucosum]
MLNRMGIYYLLYIVLLMLPALIASIIPRNSLWSYLINLFKFYTNYYETCSFIGCFVCLQEITKSAVSDSSKLSQKHRKPKCSSGMEENPNNRPTHQTTSDKNLRRHSRYAQMSPDRKQLFLSQLRAKRVESKRQKNLDQFNSAAALTITTSSLAPQQASKPTNVPSTSTRRDHIVTCLSTFKQGTSTRGEHMVDCLSSFELGSTSAACHVASKLPSTHSANKAFGPLYFPEGFFSYFQQSAHHRNNRAIEERFCYWRNTTFSSSISKH